jgi:hypothetical protein
LDADAAAAVLHPLCWDVMLAAAADQFSQVTFSPVLATMVSLFIFPFASALLAFSSLLVVFSSSAAAFQCQEDINNICTGVCCNYKDPYRLLVGPTCHIQAFWLSSENGTVRPFPTFWLSYYWGQESNGSIMGGKAAKPKKEETTEVLTMHPNWESHVNEETNSGIFFSLFNVHMSCIMSTLIFCLCIMICILLGYLGYRRFCHRPKRKSREALEATSSSYASPPPAPLTSRSWATMEDKYEMDDYGGSVHDFVPQRYGLQQQQQRYGLQQPRYAPQQPRYDNRQRYNGGPFVDPVEQLCLLLQAVPVANAPVQPALVYQAANQLAPVHQVPPPPAPLPNVLNLGAAANNANAAAAAAAAAANQ